MIVSERAKVENLGWYQFKSTRLVVLATPHSLNRLDERLPGITKEDIQDDLKTGLDCISALKKSTYIGQYLIINNRTGLMIALKLDIGKYNALVGTVLTTMDYFTRDIYPDNILDKYDHKSRIFIENKIKVELPCLSPTGLINEEECHIVYI